MPTKVVGQSLPRIDALGKVTGQTPYPGDLSMEGILHMKILFAGCPHARVNQAWLPSTPPRIFRSMSMVCNGRTNLYSAARAHPKKAEILSASWATR